MFERRKLITIYVQFSKAFERRKHIEKGDGGGVSLQKNSCRHFVGVLGHEDVFFLLVFVVVLLGFFFENLKCMFRHVPSRALGSYRAPNTSAVH